MDIEFQNKIKVAMLDLIAGGANLGRMCNLAANWIGYPVAMTIPTRTIVARSENYTKVLTDEYSDHFQYADEKEIQERITLIDAKIAEGHAFFGAFPMMQHPHINCGCFWHNHLLGVLDIPVTAYCSHREETLELVEFLTPYFLLGLRLNGFATGQTAFSMQVYLSGLLNNDPAEWIHTNRLTDSELSQIRLWTLIYLPPVKDFPADQVLEIASGYCARCGKAWPVIWQNNVIILKKAYENFDYGKMAEQLPKLPRVVVSEPFSDLKLIMNHLHACQRTVDLAAFDDTESRVVFVENYKMPIAYLALKRMPNGMTLYHPSFDLIRQHDYENETAYYETLRTFLLNEMNYQKTAEKLFIHKNTVMYRIGRIEELFRLNLKDVRVTTALYLSLFEDYRRQN